MQSSISAIILSAGSSQRMGKHKALLKIGNKTFLRHIVDEINSAGLQDTIVVLGSDFETIRQTLSWFNGKVVVNNDWGNGQLSSIITGLNAFELTDCNGVLIVPVDHPLFTSSLILELLQAFKESKKQIIIPTHRQRRGHPIIISKNLFGELRNAPIQIGMRSVVHAHEDEICEVPTEEEGVLINIDTPEDYQKYFLDNTAP